MTATAFFVLILVPLAYLFPGIVGMARGHRNATAILTLNLLLGWTLLGWVLSLVWALTESQNPAES